jgi:hypothetical protein
MVDKAPELPTIGHPPVRAAQILLAVKRFDHLQGFGPGQGKIGYIRISGPKEPGILIANNTLPGVDKSGPGYFPPYSEFRILTAAGTGNLPSVSIETTLKPCL